MTSPTPSQPMTTAHTPPLRNGEFYAKGDVIFRAPIETETETGTSINVGFPVCTVSDYVLAENVVECLNASREHDSLKARIEELETALQGATVIANISGSRIAELERALRFYADGRRYQGANQQPIPNDPYAKPDAVYIQDVTRDCGAIARATLQSKGAA
jgi:hypothetical protein